MGETKKIIRQSLIAIIALTVLSGFMDWKSGVLRVTGLFGNPILVPVSILTGGIIGMANLKGLEWGVTSLLASGKANTKLIFLSLLRLFIIFTIIVTLSILGLVNLLGLLAGMSVTFIVFLTEALRTARKQQQ